MLGDDVLDAFAQNPKTDVVDPKVQTPDEARSRARIPHIEAPRAAPQHPPGVSFYMVVVYILKVRQRPFPDIPR